MPCNGRGGRRTPAHTQRPRGNACTHNINHLSPIPSWRRFAPHTITDHEALKQDLATIRAQGFAVDNEEKNAGMRCIAAPVFDMNREAIAGISVSGPTSRISAQEITQLSRPVIEAAHALTLAIGGDVAS